MGVTGAGKTTIGAALAAELGWRFVEVDQLIPPSNVTKMHSGVPLTDADRAPWLAAVHAVVARATDRREHLVVACSALERYRRCPRRSSQRQVRPPEPARGRGGGPGRRTAGSFRRSRPRPEPVRGARESYGRRAHSRRHSPTASSTSSATRSASEGTGEGHAPVSTVPSTRHPLLVRPSRNLYAAAATAAIRGLERDERVALTQADDSAVHPVSGIPYAPADREAGAARIDTGR
jgi:hypothetical protein